MEETSLERLQKLRQKDKFSDSEWNKRGLNPSNGDLVYRMDTLFNECIDDLIQQYGRDSNQNQLKKRLKIGLSRFDKRKFDTEEKEFICDYFHEIANIIDIKFSDNLNSWLYGSILGTLIKVSNFFKKEQKILETKSTNCTKCTSPLDTFILKKRSDIVHEAYNVVKCKNCDELNMLDWGKGIDSLRYGNYVVVERLNKEEYSAEQAEVRLEQIKYFRNK
jgi:RNase P subunit RPR2